MTEVSSSLLLPPGARLLHIGPHKTGTTSLQSAFHARRREAAAQGVHYAGPNRQPMQAAHAITGKPSPYADGKTPPRSRWRDLVREVQGAGDKRVVISSEGFADADDEGIRTVIELIVGVTGARSISSSPLSASSCSWMAVSDAKSFSSGAIA